MITRTVSIDENAIINEANILSEAAEIIRSGELVAFPTETVYGLGADAKNQEASKKIYAAKGRPSDNPLIVHIADICQLEEVASEIDDNAKKLAEQFWPGPLTLVLPKNKDIPYATTGGLDTVAVRFPSHPIAKALIKQSGRLIAAPSANASGRPSPTMASHVYEDLNGRIPLIIDGGQVGIGIESTIVDCTSDIPVILRPGFITSDMVKSVCGQCEMDPGIVSSDAKPKAPGMKYRHYAPSAPLTIIEGDRDNVVSYINFNLSKYPREKVGIITTDESKDFYLGGQIISVGSKSDEASVAHNLYSALRQMDQLNVEVIFSESFTSSGLGEAVMNRLLKAAGHQVIKV